MVLKKGNDRFRRKLVHGAVEELPILRHIPQDLLGTAAIGEIAASLARDIQFFTQKRVLLNQYHTRRKTGGDAGGEHPRRTAADHRDVIHLLFRRHRTHPKSAPMP